MTQQIRDEIARADGWTLPGDKGLLVDGTSVTATAYHRKVFVEALHTYRHDKQDDHPLPDTIDAAVGVIEGAGYAIATTQWDCIDKVYRMRALTSDERPLVEVVSDPIEQETAECVQRAYRRTLWQLALACVKAGKGGA